MQHSTLQTRAASHRKAAGMAAFLARWLVRLVCSSLLLASTAWAGGLRIAVPNSPLSLPLYVADKQGFFADEGLDIAVQETPSGAAALQLLLQGQAQLAVVADLPIMFRSFQPKPFRVLATIASSSHDNGLVIRRSSGIKTAQDLQGKQVALVRGTTGQYYLDLTTLAYGLDPRSVKQVDLDLPQLAQAAADHRIDAFSVWQPYVTKLLAMLHQDAFVLAVPSLYTATFNLVALPGPGGVADEDLFKTLRALERATSFIKASPQSAKALLHDKIKLDLPALESMWPSCRFDLSLNQSLLTTLESTARWAIQERLVQATSIPNYLDFIDVGPLTRLRASAVTIAK